MPNCAGYLHLEERSGHLRSRNFLSGSGIEIPASSGGLRFSFHHRGLFVSTIISLRLRTNQNIQVSVPLIRPGGTNESRPNHAEHRGVLTSECRGHHHFLIGHALSKSVAVHGVFVVFVTRCWMVADTALKRKHDQIHKLPLISLQRT